MIKEIEEYANNRIWRNNVLKELKEYIDNKYGEYKEGDVISGIIRCKYNEDKELELYIFSGSEDWMVKFAVINDNFDIYNPYAHCNFNLLDNDYLLDDEDDEDEKITPEKLLNTIADICAADIEFYSELAMDVAANLRDFS